MLNIPFLFPGNIVPVECQLSGNAPAIDGDNVRNVEEIRIDLVELTS